MEPVTWSMISALVAGAAFALGLWNTLTKRPMREFDDLRRAARAHDERLTKVEAELEALPEAAQFHDMRVLMATIKGSIDVIAERIKPVEATLNRIQEAMLERDR